MSNKNDSIGNGLLNLISLILFPFFIRNVFKSGNIFLIIAALIMLIPYVFTIILFVKFLFVFPMILFEDAINNPYNPPIAKFILFLMGVFSVCLPLGVFLSCFRKD